MQSNEQVDHIKLLDEIFHYCPNTSNWDRHFDTLLGKLGKRISILRACKRYGYNGDMLHYLFHSLILSLITKSYALSVWGCASYSKYLCRIDELQDRAVRVGYLKYTTPIKDLIKLPDARLKADINSNSGHPLACFLPPKRNTILRGWVHPYITPKF